MLPEWCEERMNSEEKTPLLKVQDISNGEVIQNKVYSSVESSFAKDDSNLPPDNVDGLKNTETEISEHFEVNSYENPKSVISKRLYLFGPVLALSIFAYACFSLIMNQYAYHYFQITLFPNSSSNFSIGEQSECSENETSPAYRERETVQRHATEFNVYLILVNTLPGVIASIISGSLSDKYGRKLFVILPIFGGLVKTILTVVGIYLELDIYIFLFFCAIEGLGGGWITVISICFASVADTTPPNKKRAFVIVLLELMLGIGGIIGTFVSGYLIQLLHFLMSMAVCAFAAFICFLLALLLPETLKKNEKSSTVPLSQLVKNVFLFYLKDTSIEGRRWRYILCILVFMFTLMASLGNLSIAVLYELNRPFCWSSITISWFNSLRLGVPYLVCILLIRPLQRCFSSTSIGLAGLISAMAANVMEGLAYDNTTLFIVPAIGLLSSLIIPMMRSILSNMTTSDKQGTVCAGIAVAETLCKVISGVAANAIYVGTFSILRGTVYFVFAFYNLIAVILLLPLIIKKDSAMM